ncbi:hypothetical protein GH733_019535 [Mirounga leonina]|nr:hypothetical protein GH733_019535 [Mirounga leonina]
MGSSASKAAHRATTDEPTEPEAKHLADLIQYINGTNMSVKHLADILSEKAGSSSWVVVFKALVTVHHLMVHGNESLAYRLIASDITKTKRGMDGMMRTMDTKQLLNTLPVIQTQFDALLNFNANPDELTNGIIHAAFTLLFKDSLRLFAAYNEGILNLLDKYFDMRKNECKESLDIYIKFLERTHKLVQFLKVAEQVGIDRNNIPYLTQAPHSLLEALKQHLASLEENNDSLLPYSLQHAFIPSIPNNPVMKASASRAWFADLNLGESPVNKSDRKWPQPSEMEIPGGMKWQLNTYTCTSTLWKHVSIPPVPHMPSTTSPFPSPVAPPHVQSFSFFLSQVL